MARINAILGDTVNYGFEGGAKYRTIISDNTNRMEDRDALWLYPKYEFEASYGYLTDDARDDLNAVFHACRGRLHSFQFKDWNDYKITNQALVAGTAGTKETIQIYKRYDFGAAYQIRPIQALASLVIHGPDALPVAGTFDPLAGTFTPTNDWSVGAHTIASCEFYVWVRLDDDYNPMRLEAPNASTSKVSLVEDPFPFTAVNVPGPWSP